MEENGDKMNSDQDIFHFFELSRINDWIIGNDYKRIALQFPQDDLDIAPKIQEELERRLGNAQKLYILADTSYRSCCLDEIAAEHANCESIVHFGEACFSQASGKIPALYIFGNQTMDFDDFREKIMEFIASNKLEKDNVLILCDSSYSSLEVQIESVIKSVFPSTFNVHLCKPAPESSNANKRVLAHEIPQNLDIEECLLIFIGASESPLLRLFRLSVPSLTKILHYIPSQNKLVIDDSSAHKMLMKRLFLVEKVRDARTIGLVVGTTALHGCKEAISRIRALCKMANKKLYVFHIGKLNEAKLTNFGTEVDVFVMLSCPFGILLDERRFYKPIVSMIEAELALNKSPKNCLENLKWTANFQDILKDEIIPLENELTDMSLTSGAIRTQGKHVQDEQDDKQLIEYSAGDYFGRRTWKGLDDQENGSKINNRLKEGRTGIASQYEQEPIDGR